MSSCKQRTRLSKSKRREVRRRQAHKARLSRRTSQEHVGLLPAPIRSFFGFFSPCFTKPTLLRFTLLAVACILTIGCRTTANLLRALGRLAPGDPSAYRRVFCRSRWSTWTVGRHLAAWVFDHFVAEGPILLAADDTVSEHPGDKVHGKSCHRDAVRSSHGFTAYRWGHKWLVLAVLVRFPLTSRPWALPLLVVLCRSNKDDTRLKGRHRTPAEVLKLMVFVLRRWFPQRNFLLAADGGYASHDLAGFCGKQQGRLDFVSRFYPDAALYLPPAEVRLTAKGKKPRGRPAVKGAKIDTPQQVVAKTKKKTRLVVGWYGGGQRRVEVVTGTGHWYRAGQGLVELRWVYVRDLQGTHRDEYFFSTRTSMTAQEIIETYGRRWNLETTFQEMRSYLKLESTRGWSKKTVQRAEPCLFGMYTVVACLYDLAPQQYKGSRGVDWEGKEHQTFSDAMTAVRKWLWREWIFPATGHQQAFEKMPGEFQELILDGLAPAA
jgi:DDE superfamily endonuclease